MPKHRRPKFRSGASLRIHDVPNLHDEISARLGKPTESHRKGALRSPNSKLRWPNDIWMVDSPLPKSRDIGEHLKWVVDFAHPHTAYLRRLMKRGARIDIYMDYCCDDNHAGFGLDPKNLQIFTRLGIRMEVSIMTWDSEDVRLLNA